MEKEFRKRMLRERRETGERRKPMEETRLVYLALPKYTHYWLLSDLPLTLILKLILMGKVFSYMWGWVKATPTCIQSYLWDSLLAEQREHMGCNGLKLCLPQKYFSVFNKQLKNYSQLSQYWNSKIKKSKENSDYQSLLYKLNCNFFIIF